MHITTRLVLVLLLATAATTTATADQHPPVPEGGLVHYRNEPCTDPVWKLQGRCFYSYDKNNNRYVAFFMGDVPVFISQLIDGEYVEIWRRAADV